MGNVDNDRLRVALFNERPTQPDEARNWDKQLYEQYELYVELMDKVSERRNQANTQFLTANTGLVGLYVVALALLADLNILNNSFTLRLLTAVVGVCGILICLFWFALINSYRNLNTGKFAVIHELEQRLPARLYEAEWIGMRKGKSLTSYIPLTHIEIGIPIVFAVIYLVVGLVLWNTFSTGSVTSADAERATPLPVMIVTATPESPLATATLIPTSTPTP
jgi:uncharacterized membrane protein YuzA (DUF378 family)